MDKDIYEVTEQDKDTIRNFLSAVAKKAMSPEEAAKMIMGEEEQKDSRDECYCLDSETFHDFSVLKINIGAMGELEIDTYLSLGDDPKIFTEFYASDKDNNIYLNECTSKQVNFCPFCGRRLREE